MIGRSHDPVGTGADHASGIKSPDGLQIGKGCLSHDRLHESQHTQKQKHPPEKHQKSITSQILPQYVDHQKSSQ